MISKSLHLFQKGTSLLRKNYNMSITYLILKGLMWFSVKIQQVKGAPKHERIICFSSRNLANMQLWANYFTPDREEQSLKMKSI